MFRIVLWPPLLLCCLLCGQTMALIWALAGGQAAWQRTAPVRSTSLVQPPLLSTSPAHFSPPIPFPRPLLCVPACVRSVEGRSGFILLQSGRGWRSQPGCRAGGSRRAGDRADLSRCACRPSHVRWGLRGGRWVVPPRYPFSKWFLFRGLEKAVRRQQGGEDGALLARGQRDAGNAP